MSTVCTKSNITKKDIQELLENDGEKIGLDCERIKHLIKVINGSGVDKNMRKTLYNELIRLSSDETKLIRKGKQLNSKERLLIQVLTEANFSYSFIATLIDRNKSSICKELKRNSIKVEDTKKLPSKVHPEIRYKYVYCFDVAQQKYNERRLKCRKIKIYDKYPQIPRYIKYIFQNGHKWGADVFAQRINSGVAGINAKITAQTIYNCAKRGDNGISMIDFPHGEYNVKSSDNVHTKCTEVPERKQEHSIEKISEETKNSITYFQGDSVVGQREGTHNTVITLANPKSLFYLIKRSKNKTCAATCNTLDQFEKELPKGLIENILFDNGVEFNKFDDMEKSIYGDEKRFNVFYAHPYASYERGCNENKNRELRYYIPKGKNIDEISDEYIKMVMIKINNKPRKKLGYRTALEVFEEELKKINIDTSFLDEYRDNTLVWQKKL